MEANINPYLFVGFTEQNPANGKQIQAKIEQYCRVIFFFR